MKLTAENNDLNVKKTFKPAGDKLQIMVKLIGKKRQKNGNLTEILKKYVEIIS